MLKPPKVWKELRGFPHYWKKVMEVDIGKMPVAKIKYGKAGRQYFLFCEPPRGVPRKDKVIYYFHGGGWSFGSPEMFRANALVFAEQGYTVILPTQRRALFFNYFDIREDLNAILKKGKEVLTQKGMHELPVLLGGVSAGGNLAAHILYNRKELEKTGMDRQQIIGLFSSCGPLDLEPMMDSFLLKGFAGKRDSEQFRLANPIHYLQSDEYQPVLCFHGNADAMVDYQCSTRFVERLEKIRPGLAEMHTLPGGSHLDAARWSYQPDWVREKILEWILKR